MSEVYWKPIATAAPGKKILSCVVYCADVLDEFFDLHVAAESVAAIIVELVQGRAGYRSANIWATSENLPNTACC
jgi:4-aminobutyrate aminotransferase-like enzyme